MAILRRRWLMEKFNGGHAVYNLADDISEKHDLAAKHSEIVARIEKILKE